MKLDDAYTPLLFKPFFARHLGDDIADIIEDMVNWHIHELPEGPPRCEGRSLFPEHDSMDLILTSKKPVDRLILTKYDGCVLRVKAPFIRELFLLDYQLVFSQKVPMEVDIVFGLIEPPFGKINCRLLYCMGLGMNVSAKIIMTDIIYADSYIDTYYVVVVVRDKLCLKKHYPLNPERHVVFKYKGPLIFERIDTNPLWKGKSANQILYGFPGQV